MDDVIAPKWSSLIPRLIEAAMFFETEYDPNS